MGHSIFTEEQKDFLVARVPAFRDAQQGSTISAFFSNLYVEWFEVWPSDDAADDDDVDEDDGVFGGDFQNLSAMERMKNVSSLVYLKKDIY